MRRFALSSIEATGPLIGEADYLEGIKDYRSSLIGKFLGEIGNLLIHWITKEVRAKVGGIAGEVQKVILPQIGSKEGKHIKALVKMDISKPLLRDTMLNVKGAHRWINFKYDKCLDFCYRCGILVGSSAAQNNKKEVVGKGEEFNSEGRLPSSSLCAKTTRLENVEDREMIEIVVVSFANHEEDQVCPRNKLQEDTKAEGQCQISHRPQSENAKIFFIVSANSIEAAILWEIVSLFYSWVQKISHKTRGLINMRQFNWDYMKEGARVKRIAKVIDAKSEDIINILEGKTNKVERKFRRLSHKIRKPLLDISNNNVIF
ncbi:hypothetical protein ACH5RR_017309 [Cinchona calisaya]|uniref:Uncharacterized protein n=1 Tax=Cinchona calisaya TaxID=153742 RepID=A0ABD3A1Q9_9GENT